MNLRAELREWESVSAARLVGGEKQARRVIGTAKTNRNGLQARHCDLGFTQEDDWRTNVKWEIPVKEYVKLEGKPGWANSPLLPLSTIYCITKKLLPTFFIIGVWLIVC